MRCLSLLDYMYRERQSVYKTVLYKFFSHKMFDLDGMATLLLCSSHLHKAEFDPEMLTFSSGPDGMVGGGGQ